MTTLSSIRRVEPVLLSSLLTACLFLLLPMAAFALLVVEIAEVERHAWDESAVSTMSGFRAWWADLIMTTASLLGGGKGMLLVSGGFVGALVAGRRHGEAIFLASAIMGAAVLGRVFKNTLDRPRPEEARSVIGLGSKAAVIVVLATVALAWWTRWRRSGLVMGACVLALLFANEAVDLWKPTPGMDSFPSGHAVTSMAVVAAVVVLAWGTSARGWVLASGGGLLITAGLSRVYFGLHYPTDVLGGWALGIAWVAFLTGVRVAYRGRRTTSAGMRTA